MIYSPEKYKKPIVNINEELGKIQGELSDKKAGEWLIKYLKANIGVALQMMTSCTPGATPTILAEYQELHLKAMWKRNFSMLVHGRGGSKTFTSSILAMLYAIFEQGTKILICSPSFRSSKNLFLSFERIVNAPGSKILLDAMGMKADKTYTKSNDLWEWRVGESEIRAAPLTIKLRGQRSNLLIIDEFLLMPAEFIDTIIKPFLTQNANLGQILRIRQLETELIKEGKMTEMDRQVFENKNKIIALSSASYTFENLYKVYQQWISKILDENKEDEEDNGRIKPRITYFVSQLSWEAIPPDYLDKTIIEEARDGGTSNAVFQREYCAQFTDGSDSYFSAKKMSECTIPAGEEPCVQLVGDPNCKYLLSIDPNLSNSPTADYFAMSVFQLNDLTKTGVLVHNYAKAGEDLKDIINYLFYILTNFNIEIVVVDNAGGRRFIESANENKAFIEKGINLKFFDFDSVKSGNEYQEELIKARGKYNKENGTICFEQVFATEYIRCSNEHLQKSIDFKKIWFASRIQSNNEAIAKVEGLNIDLKSVGEASIVDFCDTQDNLINEAKNEIALIEPRVTPMGSMIFDLPQSLKRNNNSSRRIRRDIYTSTCMGNWAIKSYYDITSQSIKKESRIFIPTFIR